MKNEKALDELYEHLMDEIDDIEKEHEFADYFYNYSRAGKNVYYRKILTETKLFDEKWIETLEVFFPSIDRIIKNPPSQIKLEREVVQVERARKVNSETIRHLSSHTAYIQEVYQDGSVRPSKLLTTYAEKDDATYENRFLKTLIKKTKLFVQNRYVVIRDNVESFEKDHLNYTSNFKIDNQEVSLNIDYVVKKDLDNASINEHNKVLLARVEKLKRLIDGYDASPFIQSLKNTKDVHSPIMKTNMILKNSDFKNCYALWLFLDKYTSLGYDTDTLEKDVPMNNDMDKVLGRLTMFTYASSFFNRENRKIVDYSTFKETKKKSTKIAKQHVDDVVDNPDEIIMSNDVINEAYLQAYNKMFNTKISDYDKEFKTHDASVKKAIRDLLSITDAALLHAFSFKEEKDYFEYLTNVLDYKKEAESLKEQIKYAKFIREAKEIDYKNAIKKERSLQKQLDSCYRILIKDDNEKLKDESFASMNKSIKKETEQLKKLRVKVKEEIASLNGKTDQLSQTALKAKEDKLNYENEIKAKVKALKDEYKNKLKVELKKVEDKHRAKLKKEQDKLKASLAKAKQKVADDKKKMIEKGNKKLNDTKESLKKSNEEKINQAKAKYAKKDVNKDE